MKTIVVLTLTLLALVAVGPAWAFQGELEAYWRSLKDVCDTGVTPEMTRRYQAAVKAADTAGYGGGRASNFWAPKNPETAYLDCFQAGGDLR
ncbi:MAG: hypothetical protein HY726_23360 [Candidatus Rokubacteria bacterium]|nr:hypothetical protein [Candidatus Rokubacteria bacterium]